jgi:hypothetical protein
MRPRRKGVNPAPKIIPIEIITPVAIDLSERGVNLEIVARATGKKARGRVA